VMFAASYCLVVVLCLCLDPVYSVGSLSSLFNKIDLNDDYQLSEWEIRKAAAKMMGGSYHITKEQTLYGMTGMDKDQSGTISKEEFVRVKDPIEPYPQQIHLSVTTHHDEMVVMWVTSDKDLPPTVQYGLQSGKYDSSTTGTATTYDVGLDGWDGWISQVKLTGLSLNTKYYYRVGTPTTYWSDEFSFTTTKADADVPTSRDVVAVVADQGTYIPMGFEVIDQMVAFHAQDPFSLVVHAGDVCYAGTGSDWELEEVWDVWEDLVQPIAAYVPYMFAVGNHEHVRITHYMICLCKI